MSSVLTPGRAEAAFWTLLCGGLAAGIGFETEWGQRWQSPLPERSPVESEFRAPSFREPFSLPLPDSFLETTLRPIFVVTRRPAPVPPPPEPPKPAMKKEQFVLTGTTMVPEGRFAFLLEKAANKVHVVTEGKEINGMRVRTVASDRVVLSQFDDEEILILKPTKPPGLPAISMPAEMQAPAAATGAPPRPQGRPTRSAGPQEPPGSPRPPPQ